MQVKYSDQIHLLVGLETEDVSGGDEHVTRYASQVDYVVGSVHHVRGIPIDFSRELFLKAEEACGGSYEALFCEYFERVRQLIVRHRPLVIGHLDLIRMYRPEAPLTPAIWTKIHACVQELLAYDCLVEINSRGWKKGDCAYPRLDILKVSFLGGDFRSFML